MSFRNPNRVAVQLVCSDKSRTQQQFKKDADINQLVKKFKKVHGVDFLKTYHGYVGGQFGDFSEVTDYRSALEQLSRAEEIFMAQPAVVRKQFGNDTAQFLDYCHNPANVSQLIEWGLLPKPTTVDKVSTVEKGKNE